MDVYNVSPQNVLNSLLESYSEGSTSNQTSGIANSKSSNATAAKKDSYISTIPSQWQAQNLTNNYTNQAILLSEDASSSFSLPSSLAGIPTISKSIQSAYAAGSDTQWKSKIDATAASNMSVLLSSDASTLLQPSFGASEQGSLIGNYQDSKVLSHELLQRYVDALDEQARLAAETSKTLANTAAKADAESATSVIASKALDQLA